MWDVHSDGHADGRRPAAALIMHEHSDGTALETQKCVRDLNHYGTQIARSSRLRRFGFMAQACRTSRL
jgi:hypothetical protein